MTAPEGPRRLAVGREPLVNAARIDQAQANSMWRKALGRDDSADDGVLVSLLDDWGSFSGKTYREMLTAIGSAQSTVNDEWSERQPESARDVAEFYDETDTIIPLLLWWHATALGPARCAATAAVACASVGAERVLDFGCGIGSTALVLASQGMDVVLAEVARDPMRFAEWRMKDRGHIVESLDLLERAVMEVGTVDAVVSFDVFEHLPNASEVVGELDGILAPGGLLCFNQAFVEEEPDQPQHFAQCGEVLSSLHERGYRLMHVPGVLWLAQKGALDTGTQRRQAMELRTRRAVTRALRRTLDGPFRPLGARAIRKAMG